MRRALVSCSLVALALAGCGRSGSTTPARAPDPAATLRALIAAPPVPKHLLTPSSRRIDASPLVEGVGSFPDDAAVRSLHAGPRWAVAWTSASRIAKGGQREFAAYGVALRAAVRAGSRTSPGPCRCGRS